MKRSPRVKKCVNAFTDCAVCVYLPWPAAQPPQFCSTCRRGWRRPRPCGPDWRGHWPRTSALRRLNLNKFSTQPGQSYGFLKRQYDNFKILTKGQKLRAIMHISSNFCEKKIKDLSILQYDVIFLSTDFLRKLCGFSKSFAYVGSVAKGNIG